MEQLSRAIEAAQSRLASKQSILEETHKRAATSTLRYLDEAWLPRRVGRLLRNPLVERTLVAKGVAEELRSGVDLSQLSQAAHSELERVIDGSDFMPSWFLSRGAELRRTVARVRARTASGKDKKGTGFLVGPRLLMTNAHVLDWSDIGQESAAETLPFSLAEFDFEEQFSGAMLPVATFHLDPTTLCLYSPWDQLDYVLVALKPRSSEGVSIDSFGYNLLAGDVGKIAKGEPVFIVQHPNGQPKQVVLANNRLIDRDEDLPYLTYEADTDVGSSGAPVFNRQWEVVALHHAPQIARDASGRILAKSGVPWTASMGAAEVKYQALNEGIRVSRLMSDWAAKADTLKRDGSAALSSPQQCSLEGLELLKVALTARLGASPAALVVPIPAQSRSGTGAEGGSKRAGSFPRPE